jgi:phenylacetate-CoA ligase
MGGVRDKIQLLEKLPAWFNILLGKLNFSASLLYGKQYKAFKQKLASDDFDPSALLLNSVQKAIKEVPFYKEKYKDKQINSIADFQEIIQPIDKELIMSCPDDFLSSEKEKYGYDIGTTGGTSGKPLTLYAPKNRYVFELATIHHIWSRVGFNHHFRAVIRNHKLEKDFVVNPITKEVIFDGFKLDEKYFMKIYKTLKKYNIQYIHCYPSVAYEFSNFLLASKLDVSFLKSFFCGSENIFSHQRELIENKLGVRMMTWFGHSEKLVLTGECETSTNYHIEKGYGYFELLSEEGNVITKPGELGEIVGTSFYNPVMPLLRYRTGDFAELVSDSCDDCGRHQTIIKNVQGRWSGEKIYNLDGSYVTTTALNLHNDLYQKINGLQYVHKNKGELTICVIKGSNFTDSDHQDLIEHFKSKLKIDMKISVEFVEKLRKHANGKFSLLIKQL